MNPKRVKRTLSEAKKKKTGISLKIQVVLIFKIFTIKLYYIPYYNKSRFGLWRSFQKRKSKKFSTRNGSKEIYSY